MTAFAHVKLANWQNREVSKFLNILNFILASASA